MSGNFIPVAPGTANVTATYNGLTTIIPVTVNPAPPPTLPNPSGLAFLSDDFTGYANQAAFLARVSTTAGGTGTGSILYNDGANAQFATPDPTVLYNGHQTLQYRFPAGTDARPELWPLFAARSNIWFRAMIRYVPGFTTDGSGPNQDSQQKAYKLLGWVLNNALYDGSGRIEITFTTQYENYWAFGTKAGTPVVGVDDDVTYPAVITTEWQDAAWYQYIFNYRVSGTQSFCDTYMGRNAVTPTFRSHGEATNRDGLAAPGATGVCCGLNYNRVRGTNQELFLNYGFWEVVDGTQFPNPFGLVLP